MNDNIEKLLPLVQKPSRYINNEWNCTRLPVSSEGVGICFCFPDLYELGASNLGIEILYHLVNSLPDASAERCYCPDTDMEEILRRKNIPLFSIESQKPLKNFNILGFSLQYELCFTNILTMLDLAGVPLKAAERKNNESVPIILGGGPVSFNPAPVADFFDAFVVGEGEDVIVEIIDAVRGAKELKKSREEIIKALSNIEGVYVPGSGKPVKKRTVDIRKSFFPVNQIVPNLLTVHSRLNIEISRGCAHRCRFCQASGLFAPWRERSSQDILSMIEKGIPATGFSQISLLSLSVTDHSEIESIVKSASSYAVKNDVSLALPSLRCGEKTAGLLEKLVSPRRASITLAIETASPELRSIIDKQINDEDIFEFVIHARRLGWNLMKLYFMIGLPGETMEDISNIVTLVNSIKKMVPGMKFNITVSPFVPKPHTPFQWHQMENAESLEQKKDFLFRKLRADVKTHNIKMSVLEAVFARGGRELSEVIVSAWKKGARFDHWNDRFNHNIWDDAFQKAGIDKNSYLSARDKNTVLPWENINTGCAKETLFNGYTRALEIIEGRKSDKYSPVHGANSPDKNIKRGSPQKRGQAQAANKYRLKYSRSGRMRFLSHLEQIELIRRSVKRAALPVAYTEGFHPQMKMSFGPAISVGYESNCEFADAVFIKQLDIISAAKALSASTPKEFSLIEIRQVPNFFKPVDFEANVAEYSIDNLPEITGKTAQEIEKVIAEVMGLEEINVERKHGMMINARPAILRLEWDGLLLSFNLRLAPGKSVKPEKLVGKIFNLTGEKTMSLKIKRENLYSEKSPGVLIKI